MLPIFASVSVCLPPLPSPHSLFPTISSFPPYPTLLSLPPSLPPSLSLFQSPIPRPRHLFSLFSFYCLCLFAFLCVRESLCEGEAERDREIKRERVRYRKRERDMSCL